MPTAVEMQLAAKKNAITEYGAKLAVLVFNANASIYASNLGGGMRYEYSVKYEGHECQGVHYRMIMDEAPSEYQEIHNADQCYELGLEAEKCKPCW